MNCQSLAERITALQPDLNPTDVARLCLLMFNQCEHADLLDDDEEFVRAWKNASFRMEAAADQHDAVAAELEQMCNSSPIELSSAQWNVLLRAIKVQGQMLELYSEQASMA